MRAVLIIFAVFAAAPLLLGVVAAVASAFGPANSTDVLLPLPIFLLGAVAASMFIMASGIVVALTLRSLTRRQS